MAKAKKMSWCEEHGKRHALSSGLCSHPACVGKVIGLHSKRSKWVKKFWGQIQKLDCEQDAIGWIIMKLLQEEQNDGKKPTLNSTWLYYNLRQYIWAEHKKGDIPMWQVMPSAKNQMESNTTYLEGLYEKFDGAQEVIEGVINEANHYNSSGSTWEQEDIETIYGVQELKEHIRITYGEPWLLFFMDQILLSDVSKLTGLTTAEVLNEKQRIIFELSDQFKSDFQQ